MKNVTVAKRRDDLWARLGPLAVMTRERARLRRWNPGSDRLRPIIDDRGQSPIVLSSNLPFATTVRAFSYESFHPPLLLVLRRTRFSRLS